MDFVKIIEALKTAKWWLVLALMLGSGVYIFREPITKVIESNFVKESNVQQGVIIDAVVNDALIDLLEITGADRAYITRFHNGTKYYDGTHKNKMSRDYEVCRTGIAPVALMFQDIPVSLFAETLEVIMQNEFRFGDISKVPNVRTQMVLQNFGVESTTVAPYYDKHGNLIALIGIEYVGRPANPLVILENLGMEEWDSEILWKYYLSKTKRIGNLLL